MSPLPSVGPRQLHTAKLTPEERAILRHRAKGAARREYAPVLKADRRTRGAINRAFQEERQSVLGATSAIEHSQAAALRAAKQSGLSGPYLRELLHAIASKMGQAQTAVPYLLADPAKERREALTTANTELIKDQAAMHQSAAAKQNQLLKEARDQAASFLKEQDNKNKPSKEDLESLKNASLALQDALHVWHENPVVSEQEGKKIHAQQANPLQTTADWRAFAHGLEKGYDGVSIADAWQVIQHYLREHVEPAQKKLAEGRYSGAYPGNTYKPPIRFNAG